MQVGLQCRPSQMVWKFQRITIHEERHCLPGCQFFAACRALAGSWRGVSLCRAPMRTSQHPNARVQGPQGRCQQGAPGLLSQVTLLWCGFMYAPRDSFLYQHHKALSELAPRLDLDTQGISSAPEAQGAAAGLTLPWCPDGQTLRRRYPAEKSSDHRVWR